MIGVRFERVYLNEKCRTLWICLLFSLLWTHTSTLHGQARCSQIYSGRVSYDFYGRQGAFVVPNEYNLGEAGSLFSKAPEGVVVSVGTERAFQALGMSAKATHLLAVDLDPAVWVYNRINLELIRHSEGSLEKYETLRGAQSWTELVQMIGGAQKIFDKGRVHQGNWKMWMEAQQMRSMQKLLERGDHYTKNQDQFTQTSLADETFPVCG